MTLPSQHEIAVLSFPRLDGGLNLSETEERLKPNEAAELANLWWEDGALCSRPGQQAVPTYTKSGRAPGAGFAVTDTPFYGSFFLHMGAYLYRWDGTEDGQGRQVLYQIAQDVPMNVGAFFRYGDALFYKNQGGFIKITYKAKTGAFLASSVAEDTPFVPTILINADPETGAGDLYQPENRLTGWKRVTYTPSTMAKNTSGRAGDGAATVFYVGENAASGLHGVTAVYVNGIESPPSDWELNTRTGYLTFFKAPPAQARVSFQLAMNRTEYQLPVKDVQSIASVKVDGVTLRQYRDYDVDLTAGKVTFADAPAVTEPPSYNTVEITYNKETFDKNGRNPAYDAIMNCSAAAVYGSGTQLCIVLAGCPAQPNAVFWSGNNEYGLDPTYWPMEYYNLVGDTEDPVTGFGHQYGELLVFKARSVGKLAFEAVDVNGRDNISLTYTRVNDRIGCDLPGTIQLIENNLVFASTAGGVYRVASSSPAYENNIQCLSRKVNGSDQRPGLLYDLIHAERGGAVGSRFSSGLNNVRSARARSLDDGRRYWLSVNGHVWLWDYTLSAWEDPVWFRFTGFNPSAWFHTDGTVYHLDRAGRLTRLSPVFDDYGQGFQRVYQFPVQLFGAYDRLKDVLTVLIALREENPGVTSLTYLTDYERREDLTPLRVSGSATLHPRDLTFRDLSVHNTPAVFRRRPMCRHVRHFAMRLENDHAGEDVAVLYAQIQVRLLGRDR